MEMNQSPPNDAPPTYLFSAKVQNVSSVANLLRSIAFCDKVNIFASQGGLKFTVEEGKYVQASVFIPSDVFQEYAVSDEEEVALKIPLKELLDCLKIFCSDGRSSETFASDSAPNTSMKLKYEGIGMPFMLLLEEGGVKTDIQLRTEPVDELIDFDLDPIVCKIILRSDYMRDLFSEVDGNGPDTVHISVVPNERLKISATGVSGLMHVLVPHDCEVVESFNCTAPCSAHYSFPVLRHSFKALNSSQQFYLKMDSAGTVSLSFLIQAKSDSFVEFFCLPQVLEDGDEYS